LSVGNKSLFLVAKNIVELIAGIRFKFFVPNPQSIEATPAGSAATPRSSRTKPRIVLTEEQVRIISGSNSADRQAF
jgi:hypothetical protein